MSTVDVFKIADERLLIGWAAVAVDKYQTVTDLEGDQYDDPEDLVKAATDFMADARTSLLRHSGGQVGTVLHSLPLSPSVASALNIDSKGRFGWIVGIRIDDDEVWKAVKSGRLKSLSIGASATRHEDI
ncbi:XkdF-like putative serine protease domain-containing protein [Neoaquamicrobium sediminum]|uniref:XkdF-like putative serine protease domain-containing protein n=1 Tax=Neoaquamicrobium sediminum TaxID=1849104 RepID=A0ABV3WU33_9HYPH